MDILAHGLWSAAAARILNRRRNSKGRPRKKIHPFWMAFWGMFPDLFTFTPFFFWFSWKFLSGDFTLGNLPRHVIIENLDQNALLIYRLSHVLYSIGHSVFMFALVFGLFFLFRELWRWRTGEPLGAWSFWELSGWLLHILIDIPTHSYDYVPTPFLWPFSEFKFDGLAWIRPWFLVLNYAALVAVYIWMYRKKKTGRKPAQPAPAPAA